MSAAREQTEPILVKIVEERRAPSEIIGLPQTFNPAVNGPQQILPAAKRRVRAVVSITGAGTVALGRNAAEMVNGAGTIAQGSLFTAPAVFELQSTNAWYVANVTGTALVSVIAETETDV